MNNSLNLRILRVADTKYEPWEKDLEFEALIYPEFPLRPIRKELGFRYDIETK
jgi:hypothetical protein